VGSVAYAAPDAFLLVDPLVPEELWAPLGAQIERHGRGVVVFTTIGFHRRSRDEVLRRFDGTTVRRAADLPVGVETIRIPRAGETMVWLPGPRALVPGDRLLGDHGGLRLCPSSWLRYLRPGLTPDELRESLRQRLLELPVELVLVSHGQSVLENGRAALERALS
jgi:hypothetical protein